MNIQDDKVGNLGDILKHTALAALTDLMSGMILSDIPIHYIDTHTYRLTAQLREPLLWKKEFEKLYLDNLLARRYYDIEKDVLKGKLYRCSTQIVLDLLKTRPHLYLAEKNDNERLALINALKDIPDLNAPVVLDDMHKYARLNIIRTPGPVLALIDPHFVSEAEWWRIWESVFSLIKRIHGSSDVGVVMLYKWQPVNRVKWPLATNGWAGPVATISKPADGNDKHHHMAVYASRNHSAFTNTLSQLGWQVP